MDEQEELRSSYRKNLRSIDGKFNLNARFIDEIANSTIELKKRKILSAAKTNGSKLRIEDLLRTYDIYKKQQIFVAIGLMHILIDFHWSNLFSEIYGVRPSATKIDLFLKKSHWKKALFVNVGVAESIFTDQIYFLWPKKILFANVGVLLSIIIIMWEFLLTKVVIKL